MMFRLLLGVLSSVILLGCSQDVEIHPIPNPSIIGRPLPKPSEPSGTGMRVGNAYLQDLILPGESVVTRIVEIQKGDTCIHVLKTLGVSSTSPKSLLDACIDLFVQANRGQPEIYIRQDGTSKIFWPLYPGDIVVFMKNGSVFLS